jgi:hypothetical protein
MSQTQACTTDCNLQIGHLQPKIRSAASPLADYLALITGTEVEIG